MLSWLGYLLAFAALIVLAPLLGWLGHRHGRSIRGGVALASIMLGFGVPLDPPTKHLIEAKEARVKGEDETGGPPAPEPNGDPSADG
ncbi:hypothetical protein [Phenylobacterium sp.]|uniref:hypothetical protein n=1 Tax=Phenylobacterium sp. TaxID=1871053 RepID=UPI002E3558DF|nr:hypothetical protein [Phenylobacterium sp.]HEX4709159.1 hypothetical protein [Phenylobacterium sp.]